MKHCCQTLAVSCSSLGMPCSRPSGRFLQAQPWHCADPGDGWRGVPGRSSHSRKGRSRARRSVSALPSFWCGPSSLPFQPTSLSLHFHFVSRTHLCSAQPVWLGWLGTVPQTQRLPPRVPAGAPGGAVGSLWVPSGLGASAEGSQSGFLSPASLPPLFRIFCFCSVCLFLGCL